MALFIKQFDKAKAEIHKIEQSKARQARLEKIKQEASPSKSKNLAKKVVGGNNLNFNLNQKKAVRKKLDGGAGGVEVGIAVEVEVEVEVEAEDETPAMSFVANSESLRKTPSRRNSVL